ncbi:hypothetical protein [Candidatus Methanoperedens nitratireducens]|uniref:Uncharacterized protein n=1 Tax=Candidatus Methanoperedens nitratireducens TaxID=1392998 RepID=A0A284VMV0_9EURY|nr:hypothetical protein [Candidatus Methanoperedens nitroreducens]SNQ60572.1 hypothetical protein MNV_190011 [Candidatus Methanoperedens nitroreducens]
MGEITINIPSDLEISIGNLVSQGTYMRKEEAIIALIRLGLGALRKKEERKVHVIPGEHPQFPPPMPPERWPDHYEFDR